ncbi:cell division protein ZapE [Pseudoruegeria sp. SK021]|uniref:cell division protein ZapE n=1 Tax=Pseudoruegeria sp. SK021 TaxID=1933035 RepID=UPI000A248BD3|nr:cell division protein ZapE [Pseudoruegeria sp. SK021]OSP56713.1 cell division protein ZapE [Pseudoruegeria sp. SK021]
MAELKDIYAARVAEGAIRPDPAQEAVLPELERICVDLARPVPKPGFFGRRKPPEPVQGLYLWGGVGTGKSMLMDLFVAAVPVPKRRVHFHAFMQEIQSGLHEARKRGVDDAIVPVADAIAAEVRLLAFDEMQITDITDAMIVGRLFERLFAAGVVVVTTSNRPPEDLYKDGLNRALFVPFINEIKARLRVWEIQGETDYRQGRMAGAAVYFTPADAEARAALDAIWADLTQLGANDPVKGLHLRVKGRMVDLPRFHNGVARVSFWDLCGQPLGPADYLAVADAVRVLILEDVPQLAEGNFNQAKRFVTLVDALYEAKVRLVMSAAALPEDLYTLGTGSFEFERTASRLREMQGAGWGG